MPAAANTPAEVPAVGVEPAALPALPLIAPQQRLPLRAHLLTN
jgi:hypothetical protein